ncbi:MAG: UPF0175 family protein [Gemmatimonadota bacterium]|nr:UPF0175 family protein [Gemmatimonadota bacterium]MDE2724728.1 UPF0175 family protein [Gemmatimonadota bacterium]
MSLVTVTLDADLAVLLQELNQPIQETAREMIVLELYRRGSISSGKAAQLLDMSRWEFIQHASQLGIAFFDLNAEEWKRERLQADEL